MFYYVIFHSFDPDFLKKHNLQCIKMSCNQMMIASMVLTLDSRARLNNGAEIPYLGLGVYQSPPGRITQRIVRYALKIGYLHIDTAMVYGNETDVGKALRE